MSISVYGVPDDIDVAQWSQLMKDMGDANASMAVPAGLGVTVATGTRLVTVAAGRSLQAGSLAVMDAPQTLALDANTSGKPRIDLACMRVNFGGLIATAGTLVAVKGAPADNPSRPGLTQVPGGIWHTPLGAVLVPNGAGQLAASAVTDARPKGSSGSAVIIDPPGAWSVPNSSPWLVERFGGTVFMGGRFTRQTNTMVEGAVATFSGQALIPVGYRPTRTKSVYCVSDQGGALEAQLLIATDGTVTLNLNTSNLGVGETLRICDVSWPAAA